MNERTVIEAAIAEHDGPQFGAGKEPGEQGSIEWLMERVGMCTASRFRDVLDFTKTGKPGAKRTAYLWELVIERLTHAPCQHYKSVAMQHGIANEAAARMAFEAQSGLLVTETGFLRHPLYAEVGGSPDGLIDDDCGLEIKCPWNSAVHLETILHGVPDEHVAQIQGLMWITGRNSWWFASYDPRMPLELQLYTECVRRDPEYIENMDDEIIRFLNEVDDLCARFISSPAV